MGNVPVIKPGEVVAILIKLGFANSDHTSNSAMQRVIAQQFHFIWAEYFSDLALSNCK